MCVQTCAVVYVRAAAVGTTLLCACQCACSLHVRACRLTMEIELAYSHDTKHTLMHRFFGRAQGQVLDAKHQHQPTGHTADRSLHLGICARVVSAPSDLASSRQVVSGRRVVSHK